MLYFLFIINYYILVWWIHYVPLSLCFFLYLYVVPVYSHLVCILQSLYPVFTLSSLHSNICSTLQIDKKKISLYFHRIYIIHDYLFYLTGIPIYTNNSQFPPYLHFLFTIFSTLLLDRYVTHSISTLSTFSTNISCTSQGYKELSPIFNFTYIFYQYSLHFPDIPITIKLFLYQ